jgi:hypothetical protein
VSKYYGDFLVSKTVRCRFNTVNTSGVPTSLSSGAVAVSKDGADVTPSGGVTLSTDVGSVTGRNHVTIDMSVDTTTFTAGSEYSVRLSGSSAVSGTSVVGSIVGEWSVENRSVTVDSNGRIQVQSGTSAGQLSVASGVIAANIQQIAGQTASAAGTVTFPGSIMPSGNVTVGAYATGEDPATLLFVTPANRLATDSSGRVLLQPTQAGVTIPNVTTTGSVTSTVTATVSGNVTVGGYATGEDPASLLFVTPANKLATDSSGRVLLQPTQSGVTIPTVTNISSTVASNVLQWGSNAVPATNINGVPIVDIGYVLGNAAAVSNGTAQAATSTSITLASSEPSTTNFYVGRQITIVAGTASGQARFVTAYNGSTKVATVHRAWDVIPDVTSQYTIDSLIETDAYQFAGQNVVLDGNNLPSVNAKDWNGAAISTTVPNTASVTVTAISAGIAAADVWGAARTSYASAGTFGQAVSGVASSVTVGGYASGQDPGTYILTTAANKLATDSTGRVLLQPTQSGVTIPNVTTVGSVTSTVSATVPGNVTVGGYASGQDPATLLFATPANKLATDSSGRVLLQPTQSGVTIPNVTNVTSVGSVTGTVAATISGNVTVGGYATGQDPGTYILATAANKLATDSTGRVLLQPTQSGVTIPTVTTVTTANLNLSQAVPTSNTVQTVGDALNAARAQGFGKWQLVGTTLTLYAPDGTTAVRTFSLDSVSAPTIRT